MSEPTTTLPEGWAKVWEEMSAPDFMRWMQEQGITAAHVQLLGYRTNEVSPGAVELAWSVPDALLNPVGIAHGGFLAAILDDAAGLACASHFPRWVPMLTVTMHLDYIAPVAAGLTHTVTGTLVRHGRSTVVGDSAIHDPDGALLARATGVFQPNRRAIPKRRWEQAGLV